MKFYKAHEEQRSWVLNALHELNQFIEKDPDFRGDTSHEEKAIENQLQSITEGKYRVVFLGAFNVGKSTAINAFLGGAYLPMDVEECTSKLTYIERGETMRLDIRLSASATTHEMESLERALKDLPATLAPSEDRLHVTVDFESDSPDDMRNSLEPLVTVMADEDFPHLGPFREKIDELHLFLPSAVIEQDIAFVDTPGVHTISETRQEITYGIIERSHLVVAFVDSGLVGNIHDLNFIKRIIKWRGRRVFFVLNKADKLERDEIDIRGTRGPARTLIETFHRHELPEDSEVFFLSGYRALRAQQLDQGHITLDDLKEDNKLSIPVSIAERIDDSDDTARDLAAYLLGQSRLPSLKERLLDYLLFENKEGAVVESGCRFVWERADSFLLPLENELTLARDPSKFEELRANREHLMAQLAEIRANADRVLNEYAARSRGGRIGEVDHEGYEAQFRKAVSDEQIGEHIVTPLLAWLREGHNLKDARRSQFKTLIHQVEHQVDEFISRIIKDLNVSIEEAERTTRQEVAEQLSQVRGLRLQMTDVRGVEIKEREAAMAGSYVAFGASGALLGAAAGATIGSVFPVVGTAIGAGLGGLIGALGGFLTRLAWSEERWRQKLEPVIRENVMNMLVHGTKDDKGNRAAPIIESVTDYLHQRADAFYKAVQAEVDNAVSQVQKECDDLLAREEEIRRESEVIIARLEPKVAQLGELRDRAADIIRHNAEQEATRA
jgi:GTP-binding protein EngB required for normal cell division/uncharacterized membrane protein